MMCVSFELRPGGPSADFFLVCARVQDMGFGLFD